VDVEIVEGRAITFDPDEGTVTRAHVRCPLCGGSIDDDTTRRLFREGKAGQRMMAVVLYCPHPTPGGFAATPSPLPPGGRGEGARGRGEGKTYRLPADADREAYRAAGAALEEKRRELWAEWGIDPVPDEPLPPLETLGFRVQRYGLTRWGDLFNPRQQLALITFAGKVRQAHAQMLAQGADPEFAKAVVTYLALGISRLTDRNSVLCRVIPQTEAIGFTFTRQALPMLWDYIEMSPFAHPSGWSNLLEDSVSNIAHLTGIPPVAAP
jgi:hypothetical protein